MSKRTEVEAYLNEYAGKNTEGLVDDILKAMDRLENKVDKLAKQKQRGKK